MIYLITGIAGFIGSSLAHELVHRGETVRGVDSFVTGRAENLADIRDEIQLFDADINDSDTMEEACRGVDYVLHQAAIASVPRSIADPVATNRANIDGTLSVLMAARAGGVKRVIYASSSSLYGDTPTLPKHEGMLPNPISPYAVSKLAGEYYMKSFYRVYGLETVSLRYFNVFGPRQDPTSQYSGVLAKFIPRMLRGEKPTIYGDGEQSRDFTFVKNVVAANLLACNADARRAAGLAMNVAAGQRITLNETFAMLQKLTGYTGEPDYGPERQGDIKHSMADITLAESSLGYSPEVSFEDGMKQTVDWYRAQLIGAGQSHKTRAVLGEQR